jgi:hypothetical protein
VLHVTGLDDVLPVLPTMWEALHTMADDPRHTSVPAAATAG